MALAFPDPPLADTLVALRPWSVDDVPERLMAFAEPSVLRFSWPLARPYTARDARDYYVLQELARFGGEELHWALTAPGDGELFGGGSLHGIDRDSGRAALGYWLTPRARGRGIATHAASLIAGWAFTALRLGRLELTCAPDNLSSQAVARRCGFTREARLRSHVTFRGHRRDTLVFGLLGGELVGPGALAERHP